MAQDALAGYDKDQVEMMKEECILLDGDDKVLGHDTKKNCHLLENINNNPQGMLHRAFSVFLFNTKGELLLQQRAGAKITFPLYWTNTCCSHPLYREEELEDDGNAIGVKKAAQRKLLQELGIPADQVPLEKFQWLTRIHYKAPSDGQWGEHEIDYILIIQADVEVKGNPNEIEAHKYVSADQLKEIIATASETGELITPWFKLVVDNFLYKWWDALADVSSLKDTKVIHKL